MNKEENDGRRVIGATWAIGKVKGFTKNINPNFIRSRRERAKAEALKEASSSNPFKWVMIAIMFMIGAALAWYIISSGAGSSTKEAVSQGGGASISTLMLALKGGSGGK